MTADQAWRSAGLRDLTRNAGSSLGDRACLALATELGLPAITADRTWATITAGLGVAVVLIR